MTIKELLNKNHCYCVGVPISDDYHLFIEGLSNNGEAITSDFNISLVKNVIVEIIRAGVEVVDTIEVKLSTKLTVLLKQAKTKIKKGENK